MPPHIVAELAPTGVLRAGVNTANFLLVTGKTASGDPEGVAPEMAREVARRLGVPVKLVPFSYPGELADQAGRGVWDIGLIGAEPQRAQTTSGFVEGLIERFDVAGLSVARPAATRSYDADPNVDLR
jgi:polar amino acid transport system substrate-binding protein